MLFTKDKVLKGLECCVDYMCGECPYQKYESKEHILKCIHLLLEDLNMLRKEYINENIN